MLQRVENRLPTLGINVYSSSVGIYVYIEREAQMQADSSVAIQTIQMQDSFDAPEYAYETLEVKRSPSRGGWTPSARRRFAAVIIELREQRNWSREILAERSGIPLELLTELEEATSPDVGLGDAERLAGALGMPVREFIGAVTDDSRPRRDPAGATRMTRGRRSRRRGS